MTDTPESLQSALDDLTRRVAAFEKAQVEEEEPPVCSEVLLAFLERGCESFGGSDYQKAAAEIRYLRAELARLREDYQALKDACNATSALAHDYCHEFKVGRLGRDVAAEVILDARRLREGLKLQPRDVPPELLRSWTDREYAGTSSERMAFEVQRHRALLKDGGGK